VRGGFSTVLSRRFGDYVLFIFYGGYLYVISRLFNIYLLFSFIFIMVIITKSAQFPFIG